MCHNPAQTAQCSSQENCPQNPGQCRVCAGQGMPIFLVRYAFNAKPLAEIAQPWNYNSESPTDNTDSSYRSHDRSSPTALCHSLYHAYEDLDLVNKYRILRTGYVYVILGHSKNGGMVFSHIKGYEVTPEGYLRELDNPLSVMPTGPIAPMPASCVEAGHDIAASFIYLTPHEVGNYTEVGIAFANDPWPPSVCKRYLADANAFVDRFVFFGMDSLIQSKPSVGVINRLIPGHQGEMREGKLAQGVLQRYSPNAFLTEKVLEYGPDITDQFLTIHPFKSRALRLGAMQDAITHYATNNYPEIGFPAVALHDYVGALQEANYHRLLVQTDAYLWQNNPERIYKRLTSQCIEQLRMAIIAQQYESNKQSLPPNITDSTCLPAGAPSGIQDIFKRFSKFYNEQDRDNFSKNFETLYSNYATIQNAMAQRVSRRFNDDRRFLHVAFYDYAKDDPDNPYDHESAMRFSDMLASCIEGGPVNPRASTKAQNNSAPAPQDAVATGIWQKMLTNKDSLFYWAIFGNNAALKQGFFDTLSSYEQTDKKFIDELARINQLTGPEREAQRKSAEEQLRLDYISIGFNAFKDLFTSDTATTWRAERLTPAVQKLLSTATSAMLGLEASEKINAEAIKRMERLMQHVALFHSRIAVWKTLYSARVGDMTTLTQAMLDELEHTAQTGRVRVPGGGTNTQSTNAGRANTSRVAMPNLPAQAAAKPITTTGWDIATDLPPFKEWPSVQKLGVFLKEYLPPIGSGSSSMGLSALRKGLSLNNGLNFIGIYFSVNSAQSALEQMDKTIGQQHSEAVIALSSAISNVGSTALAIVGGTADAMGIMSQKVTWMGISAPKAVMIARCGALLAMVASLMEATISAMRLYTAFKTNQSLGVMVLYGGSSGFYIGAAVAFAFMFAFGFGLVLVGLAILLSFVGWFLRRWGDSESRNPLERWLDRCVFGKAIDQADLQIPGITYRWATSADAATALNAYTAAILGISPSFSLSKDGNKATKLTCKVEFPGFDLTKSAYAVGLSLESTRKGQDNERGVATFINRKWSPPQSPALPALALPASNIGASINERSTNEKQLWPEANKGVLNCTLILDIAYDSVRQAAFHVRYWPDCISKPDLMAEVITYEGLA